MGAVESNVLESEHWTVGEHKSVLIDVVQSDGTTPQTMTGWALAWELKDSKDGTVLITKTTADGISIGNGLGTGDRATVTVESDDYANVPSGGGLLYHQLYRTDVDSEALLSFGDVWLRESGLPEAA